MSDISNPFAENQFSVSYGAPSSGLGAAAAPTVLDRIKNLRLGAQFERQRIKSQNQLQTSLPAILQHISDAQQTETEAHTMIENAKMRLAAPPPDAPTTVQPNLGETIGGGLAALFSGGGLGASRAVNQTMAVAGARQGKEFENAMRRFALEHENASRDFGMGREDQVDARNRQDVLGRELRAATYAESKDNRDFDVEGLNTDTQLGMAEIDQQAKAQDRIDRNTDAKDMAKFGLGIDKEKADYLAKIDEKAKELDRKADAQSLKDKAEIMTASAIVEKGDTVAGVTGALDLLARHGMYLDGKVRASLIDAATLNEANTQRELNNRDPGLKPPREISIGDGVALQNYIDDRGGPPATLSGVLPPVGLPGPAAPAAGGMELHLRGPALNAKATLDGARGGHRALLEQNPYPEVKSVKDAEAKLSLSQRKAWTKWNDQVQTSARSLATARGKYVSLLPRPAKEAMVTTAKQVLSRIQDLSKRAKTEADPRESLELVRKARLAFEDSFGVDVDTALKAAGK